MEAVEAGNHTSLPVTLKSHAEALISVKSSYLKYLNSKKRNLSDLASKFCKLTFWLADK